MNLNSQTFYLFNIININTTATSVNSFKDNIDLAFSIETVKTTSNLVNDESTNPSNYSNNANLIGIGFSGLNI